MSEILANRNRVYWILQIGGWGIYVVVNIILAALFGVLDYKNTLVLLYLAVLGVGFTHLFRAHVKRKKWFTLPVLKMVIRALAAILIIAALIIAMLVLVLLATKTYTLQTLKLGMVLGNVFNIMVILSVWSLSYFSFHYFENYKTAEIERLVWEAAVKDFELKTLKSQLNPHFMFNALNSIRALIEEEPSRAKTAVTQLSNIFRYSLRIERSETVPLEDEVKTVMDYLALEQIRYEERLRYTVDIDPLARSVEIPPMMVQTLVENGIKHGISKFPSGGTLALSASRQNGTLVVTIKNTGEVNIEEVHHARGFGVANTKQRLHLLYGGAASFSLANTGDGFVQAEIKIPLGGY